MKNPQIGRVMLLSSVTFAVVAGLAAAQGRNAGDRLVYDVHMTGQGGRMGAGQSVATTLTLAIDRIEPDGSAHASASAQIAQMHIPDVSFDATLSPSGAILTTFDPNTLRPHMGMSTAEMKAMSAGSVIMQVQTELKMANFNTFADACAQRTLSVGQTWHAPMEMFTGGGDVVYTVTGRQQQLGHNTFVVSMQSAPNAMGSISGQGYYDPAAHLVVALRTQLQGSGPETGSTDIALHPNP